MPANTKVHENNNPELLFVSSIAVNDRLPSAVKIDALYK